MSASESAVYRDILIELADAHPSVAKDSLVLSFLSSSEVSQEQLNKVYKALTGHLRGLCEDLGYDVDLLPKPTVFDVSFTYVVGEKSDLIPDSFLINAFTTNLPLSDIMDTLPGVTVTSKHKSWKVIAHPAAVPGLRKVAAKFQCEYEGDSLTKLKELAQQDSPVAEISFGPRKTIDIKFLLIYPWLADELKKRVDARLVSDGLYRIPAAKSRTLSIFLDDAGIKVRIASDVKQMWEAGSMLFDWDGSLDGLSSIAVQELKGLTEQARKRLTAAGYVNAQQLLFTAPRRYIDRSNPQRIRDMQDGQEIALIGTIKSVNVMHPRKMITYQISDGYHSTTATYFNALWMSKKFSQGDTVLLYGKVSAWGKSSPARLGFTNPMMEHFTDSADTIFGVYPQANKVQTEDIRLAIWEVLDRLPIVDDSPEVLSLRDALMYLHKPADLSEVEVGRERLAYEELLRLQLILAVEKHVADSATGIAQAVDKKFVDDVVNALPYPLTSAQQKAWSEISADLASNRSMHRLLQGDVGSGKTTVALLTLLAGVGNGGQAAVLAPTEILATQLYETFAAELDQLAERGEAPIHMELFTNRLRGKKRDEANERLRSGSIDVAVGTHALLSEGVDFNNLTVVVVDEQHRFGVEQRAKLSQSRSDGLRPDTLVMTATPIPRTAALTVFGALDVSVLDELPPGRIPITTHWIDSPVSLSSSRPEAWKKVREEVEKGHQAYVVCPLVEESDSLQVASAIQTKEELETGALSGLRIGLVHGQIKHEERHDIMQQFKAGEFDVLVATTVIEVGVNVPNASVIVILDPQRFGMAQLHQLRGRVGRSSIPSSCYLYGKAGSEDSRRRLQALVESTDGFLLSETDLEIRGPGQMFGTSQSGISDLSIADIMEDTELLVKARDEAKQIVQGLDKQAVSARTGTAGFSEAAIEWLKKS